MVATMDKSAYLLPSKVGKKPGISSDGTGLRFPLTAARCTMVELPT